MAANRLRLLLLVNESGCFMSHRANIARAALEAGLDVHVVTRLTHEPARLEAYGVSVHHVDFPRNLRNPLTEWQAIRTISDIYRRVEPDLVHHFSAKAVLLGSMAARKVGITHVVNTFTGLGSAFSGTGCRAALKRVLATRALRRALLPDSWRVTFQNPEDMHQLIDAGIVPGWKCHLIRGSGVDTNRFQPAGLPQDRPRVVLASRMIWPKGVGTFVESARLLQDRRISAECELVGCPDMQNSAHVPESQLWQWHHEGVVKWRGHCANMVDVLSAARIVVLPTYYGEGIPKVLLEAAACGRPIITTDVRGCREIVQHGVNGLLVPPHEPRQLADAIEQLIADPQKCRQMGTHGRRIVLENFTAEQVAAATMDVYSQMLGWPQAPVRQERRAA
jgi:glycosyltransferase involved in cell wall biosynthesis